MRNWFRKIFGNSAADVSIDQLPGDPQLQNAMANAVLRELIADQRSRRKWSFVKRVFLSAFFLIGLFFYLVVELKQGGWGFTSNGKAIGVVRIEGDISSNSMASADKVVPALKKAFSSKSTTAVVLAIDSPGGSPVEAARISYVLDELKRETGKPAYAVIQNIGASAAYMIAMHADKVYASQYSLVGSVGAILSTWDVHEAIENYKVRQKVFASGPLKAMLNPFTESTPEADEKAQTLVNIMGNRFADELQILRGPHLKEGFKYNSGEIWDGLGAKDIGLVDEIGTIESIISAQAESEMVDYGPGSLKKGLFSASISDWFIQNLTTSVKNVLSGALSPEVR